MTSEHPTRDGPRGVLIFESAATSMSALASWFGALRWLSAHNG